MYMYMYTINFNTYIYTCICESYGESVVNSFGGGFLTLGSQSHVDSKKDSANCDSDALLRPDTVYLACPSSSPLAAPIHVFLHPSIVIIVFSSIVARFIRYATAYWVSTS